MKRLTVVATASLALLACDALIPPQYIPEVGYREGTREVWWLGDRYWSKQECVRVALAQFNIINTQSPRRAFSWACRVMRGETFESRTRGE